MDGTVDNLVFLVDWNMLTAAQQEKCLAYISENTKASTAAIRREVEKNGHFPIREKFVIESYSLRKFY